jgi:hypothetical protein
LAATGALSRTTICAIALAALVAADALAQAGRNADASRPSPGVAPSRPNDMRLWSFGDCERNFPNIGSNERKECARVVGSEEARETRAFHICDITNEKDRAEAQRCKSAFLANKTRAAQDGLVANRRAQPQEPLPPEVLQRVRLIAENGVEADRAAASNAENAGRTAGKDAAGNPAAAAVAAQGGGSWSSSTLVTIVGFVALALLLGLRYRGRRLAAR